jgi:dihydrodipicolinate synthase/N-acetylneuraminate lyase
MPRFQQAILVSCELPWDEQERFQESIFRREVQCAREFGFDHLYICGTAGEGYAVNLDRFKQVTEVFWDETRHAGVHTMVGAIGLSTATIVERVAIAYRLGFRMFQVVLPSWGALNDVELLTFFKDVGGTFPDATFLHYNLPRAKRVLTGADYRRIVDAVPNLVATKNTGGGLPRASDLMTQAPELQHFFGEQNFPHGCMYGECSLLSSFAPVAPEATKALLEAGRLRQVERLFRLQHFFHDLLHGVLGDLLTLDRIDGAYDKLLVKLGGLDEMPLRLLSPYQGFSEEQFQICQRRYVEKFNRGRPTESELLPAGR